ncbi:MAG TPA: hypothetical protein VIV12_29920 [Streptosporangiaceae bacterium]
MRTPPAELYTLGLAREQFVYSDARSWRGPCPRCGGHRRLLIFTDNPFPKWHCRCDGCGLRAWADQLAPALSQPVSEALRAEWDARNRRERESRERYRREKLAEFSQSELLAEYHERLTDAHRAWWESQGIPKAWQDHLRLGYTPDRPYRASDGQLYHSPAYTIPYFHTGFEFQTLQYRLFEPPTPTDRYRFEHGLGTTYYQAEPAEPVGEHALICEGAKKAMVAHIYGETGCSVLAVPSKSDFGGVADAVKDCERVYVLLDPDAELPARKLAAAVGDAARVVELPVKVDDAIWQHGLTARQMAAYLRQAV